MREHPWGIGFWMKIAESKPPSDVWIWVTAERLDQLDPKQVRDVPGRARTFDAKRQLIEQSASGKFDKVGLNPIDGMREDDLSCSSIQTTFCDPKPRLKWHTQF
jgi:hypothetical protein